MSVLRRSLRLLAVLTGLSVAAFVVGRVAERGRFTGAYSSYGGGPRGARALYLLAEHLQAHPARWSQDLANLPSRGMLVALGGCDSEMARKLSRYERLELLRWVKAGGVLLVAGARAYLPDELGVGFDSDPGCKPRFGFGGSETPDDDSHAAREPQAPSHATPARPPPLDAGTSASDASTLGDAAADGGKLVALSLAAPKSAAQTKPQSKNDTRQHWAIPMAKPVLGMSIVAFRRPGRLHVDAGVPHEVLMGVASADEAATDPNLEPLVVSVARGRGRIIVLASASMFQNRDLLPSQGGALFARLLRSYASTGPVLFDEYHLGVGERRSLMRYLRQAGAMPIALRCLLIAGLLLWRAGARFGAVRQPLPAAPRGSASFVAAMGRLYQSAGDPAGAIDTIARQALARIAAHHHLAAGSARKLEHALRERLAVTAADAVHEIELVRRDVGAHRTRLALLTARIDAAAARATATSAT
ncbi:MAG TPA: hypothetical protein VF331_25620 [Polyangiales bacterium]